MGLAGNGQGGKNFAKYAIWLDRGYLRYELGAKAPPPPTPPAAYADGKSTDGKTTAGGKEVAAPAAVRPAARPQAGHLARPASTTPSTTPTDIMWDDDVGFDGIAAQARYQVFTAFTPFLNGGAFPFFNTTSISPPTPGQVPLDRQVALRRPARLRLEAGPGFQGQGRRRVLHFRPRRRRTLHPLHPAHRLRRRQHRRHPPGLRPKGNTYMALRNIVPTADNNFGTTNQWQYFGLATPFRVLAINGQIDYSRWSRFTSPPSANTPRTSPGRSAVGNQAVNKPRPARPQRRARPLRRRQHRLDRRLRVGSPVLAKRWDWNVGFNYRYVESDAWSMVSPIPISAAAAPISRATPSPAPSPSAPASSSACAG
ncbi:MAG: putative porin [Chthoniobacter sp.]